MRAKVIEADRSAEVRFPFGLEPPDRQSESVGRCHRASRETKTGVLGAPVLLARVAPAAGRDDVVPGVEPALGPGHHVIQVLGGRTAVLTCPAVACEDGA